ncbi:DinB family protein [Candidatus Sumerlaeota bacterium]|nr:DinB family protein [Candidatus Sumerlaeota bacterium]
MNWTQLLKDKVEYTYSIVDNLIAMTEGLPLDWKPSPENNWMTTGQLLMHIIHSCGAPMKGFVTGDWGIPNEADAAHIPPAEQLPSVNSADEARRMLAEDKATALRMIDQAGEDRLANEPAPAPWDPRPAPLGQRLLSMIDHIESHKFQLFFFLKLQGKPVNTMHLWAPPAQ